MKITHNKVGQNLNLTDASRTDKSDKTKQKSAIDSSGSEKSSAVGLPFTSSSGDSAKVDLSTRAQDTQRAKEIAMSANDFDQAKVEKFQKLIDEGKYKIDSKAIAERMVDEHLLAAGKTSNE